MKSTKRHCFSLVAVLVLLVSCTSSAGGEQADDATTPPVPATETPEAEPTVTPTATPEPIVLSDEAMISAAEAAFAAGPGAEYLAWDQLDARASDGLVEFTICAWTGEDVFDQVLLSQWQVEPDDDGQPVTTELFTTPNVDTCLNTELIDSALAATRDHDNYWRGVLEDPTTFDPGEAAQYLGPELIEAYRESTRRWTTADQSWKGTTIDARLPDSALFEVLWRRYDVGRRPIVELLSCRNVPAHYGLYQRDVLVENFREEDSPGEHVIHQYRMEHSRQGGWRVLAVDSLVWSNCDASRPDWLAGINEWQPDPVPWEVIPGA